MGPLTLTEQQHLRQIVEAFWGASNTAHWEMNEALLGVVAYSAASRPPIPIQVGHPFRFKPATYSD